MEAILVGIDAFCVWLVYFKFKWLPWTTPHKVTVVVIAIVGLTVLILSLDYFAPSSNDVRVIKYVVQIVPQVRGGVIDVPAAGNRPMKKGEVLFRIDSAPYELDVKRIEAQLALAQTRLRQTRELAATGAGSSFDEERYASDVRRPQAQLDQARWDLSQTTVYAPADGGPINVQLRPGLFVVSAPLTQAMSFVEDEYRDNCALSPERADPGGARQRGRDGAADLSRPDHQGQGRLHRLGAGPGAAGAQTLVELRSAEQTQASPTARVLACAPSVKWSMRWRASLRSRHASGSWHRRRPTMRAPPSLPRCATASQRPNCAPCRTAGI